MTLSPGIAGFLKGLMLVVVLAVVDYLANSANLGFLSPAVATIVAGIASAIESSIKADTGKALFGAVSVKKV